MRTKYTNSNPRRSRVPSRRCPRSRAGHFRVRSFSRASLAPGKLEFRRSNLRPPRMEELEWKMGADERPRLAPLPLPILRSAGRPQTKVIIYAIVSHPPLLVPLPPMQIEVRYAVRSISTSDFHVGRSVLALQFSKAFFPPERTAGKRERIVLLLCLCAFVPPLKARAKVCPKLGKWDLSSFPRQSFGPNRFEYQITPIC